MTLKKTDQLNSESFESLLEKLEAAVGRLENEELPLDEAIAQYQAAMTLVTACRTRLDEAEKTVNLLVQKNNGDWKTEPLPDRDDSGDN
ncbi:MAG: exodeoxyribonuclease VII small subunit [Candidatus Marinimicrobia bacterium]|nr:exodeoxyribonuclease VII small subunit [Candidatus Neomarinimicrobiota bacterium]MCF7840048.1 exodeoxyribonuclease VII small subunit [Candidatus Neomarinimicrobiota bacterium]